MSLLIPIYSNLVSNCLKLSKILIHEKSSSFNSIGLNMKNQIMQMRRENENYNKIMIRNLIYLEFCLIPQVKYTKSGNNVYFYRKLFITMYNRAYLMSYYVSNGDEIKKNLKCMYNRVFEKNTDCDSVIIKIEKITKDVENIFKNILSEIPEVLQIKIIFVLNPDIVQRTFISKNIKKKKSYVNKSHIITISYFEYENFKIYYFESKKYLDNENEDTEYNVNNEPLINFLVEDTFIFNSNCIDNIIFVPGDLNPESHIFKYVKKIGRIGSEFKFLSDSQKLCQIHKYLKYEHRKNALMFCEIFKNIADNSPIEKVFNNEYLKREIISYL